MPDLIRWMIDWQIDGRLSGPLSCHSPAPQTPTELPQNPCFSVCLISVSLSVISALRFIYATMTHQSSWCVRRTFLEHRTRM